MSTHDRRSFRGRTSLLVGAAFAISSLLVPVTANAVVDPQTLIIATWDGAHNATWDGTGGQMTLTLDRTNNTACFESTFNYTTGVGDPIPDSTAINDSRPGADPATVIEFTAADYPYVFQSGTTYTASGCKANGTVPDALIDDIFAQAGTDAEGGAYVAVVYDNGPGAHVGIGGFLDHQYATADVTVATKLCAPSIQTVGQLTGHEGDCVATTTGFDYLVTDGTNLHSTKANADTSGSSLVFQNADKANTVHVTVTDVPSAARFGHATGAAVNNVTASAFDVDPSGGDTTATVYLFSDPGSPPIVTSPVVKFRTGVQYGPAAVRVSWTGADVASIDHFTLQVSRDGGAYTTLTNSSAATFADTVMSANHSYRFRVSATDDADNTSGWKYSATDEVKSIQDTSSRINYGGAWAKKTSSSYSGGSTHKASSAGKTASLSFTGRAVAWVAPQSMTRGKAKVYIDGNYKVTIDLGKTAANRMVQYTTTWSSVGSHKITIKVLGTSGRPRVDLDTFLYIK